MTSKERVLAAIDMKPVDRQPRDFHACNVVLDRLYEHFGVNTYKELLQCLHGDIVDIRGVVDPDWVAPFPKQFTRPDGSIQNYLGFVMKEQETIFGPVMEHSDYLMKDCLDLDEIKEFKDFQFPKVEWFDFSTMSERLKEYEDFAIMATGASIYQHPTILRGLDVLLCDMVADPEIADYIMDAYTDFYYDYYKAMFEACPGQIDILRIADDLGMQDRPLVSRELFDKYFFPRIKKLTDLAHSYGVKVMFHSCGCVFDFIDGIIEAGVDMLDPLQPNAKDMNPEKLQEYFGGKICMHGSIDTQYVLPQGTPEEVRAQVRKHISILGQSGTGFIIAPAHTLQPDVKVENIVALYDEVDKVSGLS